MIAKLTLGLIGAALLTLCPSAGAQQSRVPRVGYLSASSASEASVRTNAFRRGLSELGYMEGKTIIVELRYAEENSIGFRLSRPSSCGSP